MNRSLRPLATRRQRGVTLTELMIALVLGALVVLAATAMVVTSRGTYRTQDENTRLAESARFGLELANRLARLAGYTNFGDDTQPPASYLPDAAWALAPDSYAFNGPNVVGSDNSMPGGGAGLNGSDSLTIRFFGSSPIGAHTADGNVIDCAGTAIPQAPTATSPTVVNASAVNNAARAYNVLFVAPDTDGEPALKCETQSFDPITGIPDNTVHAPQTLIRGVEDFQVLYGELMPQLPPNDDLDNFPPQSIVYRTGIGGVNPVLNWNNVRAVRISMLLRSAVGARPDPEPTTKVYNLFGSTYAATQGGDTGAAFALSTMSTADRTRIRQVVETTVFIRNRMSDWASVFIN